MSIMKLLKTNLIAALLVIFLSPALSATVLHDESVDGDLPVVGFPVFNLVLGLNQVIGNWPSTPGSNGDRFDVTLVAGLQIDSIIVTYGVLQNGEEINTALSFSPGNLFDDAFGQKSWGSSQIVASFVDTFPPDVGPLDKTLTGSKWGFELYPGVIYAKKDWMVDIVTSSTAVSEPSTSLLLVSALALAGLVGIGGHGKTMATGIV